MRLEKYIREEWATKVGGIRKLDVDIFRNPDKSDFGELGRDCRFIADNKKKELYVWNAEKIFHGRVARRIFGGFSDESDDKYLYGVAEKKGTKWKMTECDTYELSGIVEPDEMMKIYKWVNKYIDITEYFEKKLKAWKSLRSVSA